MRSKDEAKMLQFLLYSFNYLQMINKIEFKTFYKVNKKIYKPFFNKI